MASQGPLYPTSASTVAAAPENANAWVNPTRIVADDASFASITAATYDLNDISDRLTGGTFGFTIPAGATIDGIVVEIDQDVDAGSAKDYRVQLLDETQALVGNNKATATAWPSTSTVATYGSPTDTWGWTTVTAAKINSTSFGVVQATQATADNTDIGVDFIRVTVYYTAAELVDYAVAHTAAAVAAVGSVHTLVKALHIAHTAPTVTLVAGTHLRSTLRAHTAGAVSIAGSVHGLVKALHVTHAAATVSLAAGTHTTTYVPGSAANAVPHVAGAVSIAAGSHSRTLTLTHSHTAAVVTIAAGTHTARSTAPTISEDGRFALWVTEDGRAVVANHTLDETGRRLFTPAPQTGVLHTAATMALRSGYHYITHTSTAIPESVGGANRLLVGVGRTSVQVSGANSVEEV